jgi:hypothetical protein
MLSLGFQQLDIRKVMDYNELLFAYHVRMEAMERIQREHPDGLSDDDLAKAIDDWVNNIVRSTVGIAAKIQPLVKD